MMKNNFLVVAFSFVAVAMGVRLKNRQQLAENDKEHPSSPMPSFFSVSSEDVAVGGVTEKEQQRQKTRHSMKTIRLVPSSGDSDEETGEDDTSAVDEQKMATSLLSSRVVRPRSLRDAPSPAAAAETVPSSSPPSSSRALPPITNIASPEDPASNTSESVALWESTPQSSDPADPIVADVVEMQNMYREAVGLNRLEWHQSLSDMSLRWSQHLIADGCAFRHSRQVNPGGERSAPPFNGIGENLYRGSASMNPTGAHVAWKWFIELQSYRYAPYHAACSMKTSGAMVGHFTQIMWSTHTHIGCARAQGSNGAKVLDYLSCHYGNLVGGVSQMSGNIGGVYPFETPISQKLHLEQCA